MISASTPEISSYIGPHWKYFSLQPRQDRAMSDIFCIEPAPWTIWTLPGIHQIHTDINLKLDYFFATIPNFGIRAPNFTDLYSLDLMTYSNIATFTLT